MVALSAGYILAAADITAAVGMSAVAFVAVEVAEDTPVAAAVVTGRGAIFLDVLTIRRSLRLE
jgi:hypothetical protein